MTLTDSTERVHGRYGDGTELCALGKTSTGDDYQLWEDIYQTINVALIIHHECL